MCLCKCLHVLSGEGVKTREQVPIVQHGVMRAVMRVWVSRAAHCKCTTAGPRESQRTYRGGVVGISEDRGADSSEQPSLSNYHTGSRSDTVDFDNTR